MSLWINTTFLCRSTILLIFGLTPCCEQRIHILCTGSKIPSLESSAQCRYSTALPATSDNHTVFNAYRISNTIISEIHCLHTLSIELYPFAEIFRWCIFPGSPSRCSILRHVPLSPLQQYIHMSRRYIHRSTDHGLLRFMRRKRVSY